jgi:squalene-hopene/tetraprenyl-beta-curcumene cyclase
MKSSMTLALCGFIALVATALVPVRPQAAADEAAAWNQKGAAAYLDQRSEWWSQWQGSARDHGTFCVSCHTAMPYAIGRPALRRALGEAGPSAPEKKLLENITKRVTMWKEVEPFYPDQTRGLPKSSESRGTEAVLNALILSSYDARNGSLSAETRRAFDNLWPLQMLKGDAAGSWTWLNFHYEPWEGENSQFLGATLAAVAVGVAPGGYAASPDIQEHLKLLREYLQKGSDKQHLLNRVMLLWASSTWPGLLTREQQQTIVDAALRCQQDDGGWSASALGSWKRVDGTALDVRSDGYATGLIALALQGAGDGHAQPQVKRALAWLVKNQDPSGMWFAASLNKQRDPATDAGRFMSDAATAYAVLALSRGR